MVLRLGWEQDSEGDGDRNGETGSDAENRDGDGGGDGGRGGDGNSDKDAAGRVTTGNCDRDRNRDSADSGTEVLTTVMVTGTPVTPADGNGKVAATKALGGWWVQPCGQPAQGTIHPHGALGGHGEFWGLVRAGIAVRSPQASCVVA